MPTRRLAPPVMAVAFLVSSCVSEPAAPTSAEPEGLVPVTVAVPDGMDAAPLDVARQALVPRGWTLTVFARVPSARLAVWAPDRTLLVSVPRNGTVVRLTRDGKESVLLDGLTQPHGLTFSGSALYVAQSDRVDAYTYDDGAATDPRPIVTGLPDAVYRLAPPER
jgi:glucose/arabinose dehydrogenase